MSPQAKWEYMKAIHIRYHKAAGRKEKSRILDEFCRTYGCHRKHALRLLNGPTPGQDRPRRTKRTSPYDGGRFQRILEEVWHASGLLCGQRLKAVLRLWKPRLQERFSLTPEEATLLDSVSSATIDRRLKRVRLTMGRRIYGTTRPGRLLKHHIPIKTDSWDVDRPGFCEVDTVSHSGDCGEGVFAHSLNLTDVLTGWVERRCLLGKNQEGIRDAIDDIRSDFPFALLGIDADNGSEFINHHLWDYCQSAPKLQFTRGRPYKKDDNAHVEQKNWTHVRKLLGYGRYDTAEAIEAVNDLYRHELRWFQNLFQPSMKLLSKTRVGSKLRRRYDAAKTPLERVIESGHGDADKSAALLRLRDQVDPFVLASAIDTKLKMIWAMRSKAPKPAWLAQARPTGPENYKPPEDLVHIHPPFPVVERLRDLRAREGARETW